MSGLHDGFDEIVADVPVYGDLDRAFERADRERRRRYGVAAGLVAAAAVAAVIVGMLAVTRDGDDSRQPIDPATETTPPPEKSQSAETWADTRVAATTEGRGWVVPDPLKAARDAWFAVVAEHLDPTGGHLGPWGDSFPGGEAFVWPGEGSSYSTDTPADSKHSTFGRIGLIADRGIDNLFDEGCRVLQTQTSSDGTASCSTERFEGPGGERARISSLGRRCGAYEGGGPAPATCGDYKVAVAVERRDGLIGYVVVDGRGTPDFNPFTRAAMAAVAADPRISLPETA